MFVIKPRPLPVVPDYAAACRQTVTVYNVVKIGTVSHYIKTVFTDSAYLGTERLWSEQTGQITAKTAGLLVIPQGANGHIFLPSMEYEKLEDTDGYFTLKKSDKAYQGIGPDISPSDDKTGVQWISLTATNYNGVLLIGSVAVERTLQGEICHIEGRQ